MGFNKKSVEKCWIKMYLMLKVFQIIVQTQIELKTVFFVKTDINFNLIKILL
jgi:hypothetical protein